MQRFGRRTAVVTGGAGFIGSHLCDALVDGGAAVICVDNLVASDGSTRNIDHLFGHPAFTFVKEDVVDWAADPDLDGVDWIFNEAASKNTVCLRDPERDLMVNALGTLRLLMAAQRQGVAKFVHGSTGSVYGERQGNQDEKHPKDPVSFYGVSKLCAESYCRVVDSLYGLDCTVLRYYHVIGSRQDDSDVGGVAPIFVRNCLAGEPITIFGTGEQARSFTSVYDVVEANLRMAELGRESAGYFNCASGIRVSIQELADFVVAETGGATEIRHEGWKPGDILEFDVDNSRIRSHGISFDTDWRSVVLQLIAHKRLALALSLAAVEPDRPYQSLDAAPIA